MGNGELVALCSCRVAEGSAWVVWDQQRWGTATRPPQGESKRISPENVRPRNQLLELLLFLISQSLLSTSETLCPTYFPSRLKRAGTSRWASSTLPLGTNHFHPHLCQQEEAWCHLAEILTFPFRSSTSSVIFTSHQLLHNPLFLKPAQEFSLHFNSFHLLPKCTG